MRPSSWPLLASLLLLPLAAHAQHSADAKKDGAPPPLFDNLGKWHHKITTTSPKAQKYFDQGLRLLYGFNHDEATGAFREAVRLDPYCAMAWWGIAFSAGPNYNLAMDSDHGKIAYEAAQKAVGLKQKASAAERDYIDAIATRYSADPAADRKALDRAFADAMKKVHESHPKDPDAAVIYAESMMDLRPWDLWTKDGKPQPGTEEVVATLEAVLKSHPDHPGANHYYIHAVEASNDPGKATPSADRLPGLMPGAGHLVHMPAHTYIRTGRYSDAADTNVKAIKADREYIAKTGINPAAVYPSMYFTHNIHFLWAAACFDGRSETALKAAHDLIKEVPIEAVKTMPMVEYFLPTVFYTHVRFGAWEAMLKEPAPQENLKFTTGMWHFGRAMALAATGKPAEAQPEADALDKIYEATPQDHKVGLNSAKDLLCVAHCIATGRIAEVNGKMDDAIKHLTEAAELEDKLAYEEPPAWCIPARHSLGAVLLKAGKAKEAEAVYREDLKHNIENGWALYGLRQAVTTAGGDPKADKLNSRLKKAWGRADVKMDASRF